MNTVLKCHCHKYHCHYCKYVTNTKHHFRYRCFSLYAVQFPNKWRNAVARTRVAELLFNLIYLLERSWIRLSPTSTKAKSSSLNLLVRGVSGSGCLARGFGGCGACTRSRFPVMTESVVVWAGSLATRRQSLNYSHAIGSENRKIHTYKNLFVSLSKNTQKPLECMENIKNINFIFLYRMFVVRVRRCNRFKESWT